MKTAFAVFFLSLGLASAQFASAASRGVISDPDGFTNVRAKPSENAAIVARVKAREVFVFEYDATGKETWWKVKLASGKTGWMHSRRIRIFAAPEDLKVAENDEANDWARRHGVGDYLAVIRAAAKGDPVAMQQFFGVGCDGAACDVHVEILIKLIHILGDEKLAKFLSRQSPSFNKEVAELIMTDNALEPFGQISYMKRNFPKTARLLFPR
jgi:uncharacterized protein YgiM (DUF1202 family)